MYLMHFPHHLGNPRMPSGYALEWDHIWDLFRALQHQQYCWVKQVKGLPTFDVKKTLQQALEKKYCVEEHCLKKQLILMDSGEGGITENFSTSLHVQFSRVSLFVCCTEKYTNLTLGPISINFLLFFLHHCCICAQSEFINVYYMNLYSSLID